MPERLRIRATVLCFLCLCSRPSYCIPPTSVIFNPTATVDTCAPLVMPRGTFRLMHPHHTIHVETLLLGDPITSWLWRRRILSVRYSEAISEFQTHECRKCQANKVVRSLKFEHCHGIRPLHSQWIQGCIGAWPKSMYFLALLGNAIMCTSEEYIFFVPLVGGHLVD